jgi:subtilisin family serine protease
MKRTFLWAALILLAASLPAAAASNNIIVRCLPTSSATAVASRNGLTFSGTLDDQPRDIFIFSVPAGVTTDTALARLGADPDVVDAEVDALLAVPESPASLNQSTAAILDKLPAPTVASYFGTPVLGLYLSQPAASIVRLWDAQTTFKVTGTGVVAIIDTGVDTNHPVLKNNLVPGFDFVHGIASGSEMADLSQSTAAILDQSTAAILDQSTAAILDQSTAAILDQSTAAILDTLHLPPAFGHGTMVAGVVHLVAPSAKIMPLKAFRGDGTADLSNILRAIYYAADHGARFINMSFSLFTGSTELRRAIGYANNKSVIMIASAGNTGTSFVSNPAAMAKVIGVASTSNADQRSTFSSYGTGVWVAAPGEKIITTFPGGHYAAVWGTSFSAPLVTGTASLLVQVDPTDEYSGVSKGVANAKPLTPDLGNGRLDIYRAVRFALQHN